MENKLILRQAETTEDVISCFQVMRQLRPGLLTPADLLEKLATQSGQGYRLLALWEDGKPVALAGYRQLNNMIHGRFIYVDDLVTDKDSRSRGHGERLLDALRTLGREQGCRQLVLDTAVANVLAQRFYARFGLATKGLHLSMDLQ